MNLLSRFRRWYIGRSPHSSSKPLSLLLLPLIGVVYYVGALKKTEVIKKEPPPLIITCDLEEEQVLEYQNRLDIKEQALVKFNEVNVVLRERYRFLLSMVNSEIQLPQKPLKRKGVRLRHLSVSPLQPFIYQYRVFLDFDQHKTDTVYSLTFKFDRGEEKEIIIDSSGIPLSKGERIAIPFVGELNTDGRKLVTSIFYVREKDKEIFKIQSKYEGE